jgi:hypothetical protein
VRRRHALAVIGLLPFLAHAQRPPTPDWVTEMQNAQANAPDWLKEQQEVFARNAIARTVRRTLRRFLLPLPQKRRSFALPTRSVTPIRSA